MRTNLSCLLAMIVMAAACQAQDSKKSDAEKQVRELPASDGKISSQPAKKSDAEKQVREQFALMKKLAEDSKYSELTKHMTPAALDDYAIGVVMDAAGRLEIHQQLEKQLGGMAAQMGFGKSNKKIAEVLKKHDLNVDLAGIFTASSFQATGPELDDDSVPDFDSVKPADGDPKKQNKPAAEKDPMEEINSKVLKTLNDKGKAKWDVIKEIKQSLAGPGMFAGMGGGDLFSRKAGKVAIADDGMSASVTLVVPKKKPKAQDGQGMQMQIVTSGSPPIVIRMVKQKGEWVSDGIDEKATNEALKSFSPPAFEFPGQRGGRSDF